MAEGGIVDNFIGHDEVEATESSEAAEAIRPVDAVAVVVAMEAARFDSGLSRKAADYLEKQRELTQLAIKHFNPEHHLALRAAKRKAISDRFRIVQQFFLLFIPLSIIVGIGFLIYGAVTSHSIIVNTFQAAAVLAPSGVTGQVVAGEVLDELQKLQDSSRSHYETLGTKGAWSSEVKIEVPETGLSLGEIDRFFHEHLGHDIHIDGDLIQTPKGELDLTVRGEGVVPQSFSGSASDLPKLTAQAAEYICGRTQPYNYLLFLQNQHRYPEALQFVAGAYLRAGDDDLRSRLANGWGNTLVALDLPSGAPDEYRLAMSLQVRPRKDLLSRLANVWVSLTRSSEAAKEYRLATSLEPYYWTPRSNLIFPIAATEGEEAAWRESKALLQLADEAPRDRKPERRLLSTPAQMIWDMPLVEAADLNNASLSKGSGTGALLNQPELARVYALLHDPAATSRYLSLSDPKEPETQVVTQLIPILQAEDGGNLASAAGYASKYWELWLATPQVQVNDDNPCMAALALGMAGRVAESDTILRRIGMWSRCTAVEGRILEHEGKLAEAEDAWAAGIAHSPDLPADYLARGLSEENRGDFKSAEADLAKASRNAPHFADPLKFYGDLLARKCRWAEALAKYNEAIMYAPNWTSLQQARDKVAGKH